MPSPKAKKAESPIQAWHIALFVVAAIVVGWMVFGMARERISGGNAKVVQQQPTPGVTPPAQLAPAGSGTARMFEEKDRP